MSREKAITHSQPNSIELQSSREQEEARERPQTWMYRPEADILQSDEEYTIVLDMPGVSPENVDVTVEQGTLRVHGRIDENRLNVNGRFIRQEYGIGDYVRQFGLDDTVDTDRISAECRDGVLRLHLPRHEATRPHRIPIHERSSGDAETN